MRVNGRSEYSDLGKAEWIPGISSFIGIGRLIHSLYCAIFSPKAKEDQPVNPLKGRVQFWSDEKRAAVALIPIFGNALIIWHDCRTNQKLNQLENQLCKAPEADTEQVFSEFPDEVKNSKPTMLNLVKVNPEILKYSDLKNDATFMQQVAIQKIEDLKYAPETMMRNKVFILAVVEATDLDLFANFPQLIEVFSNDPDVMLEMAKRNLRNLEYAPETMMRNKVFILAVVEATDLDLFANFPQLIEVFSNDPDVMLEMAKRNLRNLECAAKLMDDENFVLDTAKKLYDDSYASYAYRNPRNRPSYCSELDILRYAPTLCMKEDFMLKAKLQSYLNPIKYAVPHFADNGEFILKMMAGYRRPGGWFSGSFSGIQIGTLSQTLPLEKIASKDLKNNVDFMKRAIEIDNESWKFASEAVKNEIFRDRVFLSKNCNDFTLMTESLRYDRNNIDLVSSSLLKDERFKKFVSENYPSIIYKQYCD